MVVATSFGRVNVYPLGIRTIDTLGADLSDFIIQFSSGVSERNYAAGNPRAIERVIRHCCRGEGLPEELTFGDVCVLAGAIWEVSGLGNLGKAVAPFREAVQTRMALTRIHTQSTKDPSSGK